MTPLSNSSWWERAKCQGQPMRLWIPSVLPPFEPEKSLRAEEKCSGCPVIDECGMDALVQGDTDVIRGGVALEGNGSKLEEGRAKLRKRLGLPDDWKPERRYGIGPGTSGRRKTPPSP